MLQPGQSAPEFDLPSTEGTSWSLSKLAGRYAVIYFYPRDNTPGCTTEAKDFRDLHADFKALDAQIVGVSPDSLESHATFCQDHSLDFVLLSDPERTMINDYGAWGEKSMYGKKSVGLIRSTVILSPEGKVLHVFSNVRAKGHAARVLKTLHELRASS